MADNREQKKSPGESFAEMFKEFGSAMSEIFNDPQLKEKAKEFGESAAASAKTFAARFKDEDVKNKFKDVGKAAKKFGETMSDYFKEDKSKPDSGSASKTAAEPEDESKKKLNNQENKPDADGEDYWNKDHQDRYRWSRERWDRDWRRASRPREARVAGYSFSIAWFIILIVFFNFFNKYIAYYVYDSSLNKWNIHPLITNNFKAWLPILTISLIISIIGNIVLIINDSFYFRNITFIIMNIFSIASVSTLLSLFPFDFSIIPTANWNAILFPIISIILILIVIGLVIGSFVRFVRLVIYIARSEDRSGGEQK